MKLNEKMITSLSIHIIGLVQGVGFRPFIYRLAQKYKLKGWIENRNDGVHIKVEGNQNLIDRFINSIKENAPIASNITSINTQASEINNYTDFQIIKSQDISQAITDVSPDIAVCEDCLQDMKSQDHRINYPFINCTNCGPRFTIIRDLPYDREKTTMDKFIMCNKCENEYNDILNRRFHAQPIACNNCGPVYQLISPNLNTINLNEILEFISNKIDNGYIVAIKGLGGFHLACNALDDRSVMELRVKKNRDGRPFAVMFKDIDTLKEYCDLNTEEERLVSSWRKPIVLLKSKKPLASEVSVKFNTIGAMLPYMPIHYMLFEKLKTPIIVLTSGNISEEPIIINNNDALQQLKSVTDTFLIYNRNIHNRSDDSVVMVINKKERILRRSKGFVPNPINLKINVDGILACGAELVNCFCLGKGSQAILSQHIGDLKNLETLDFYTESIGVFKKIYRMNPVLLACDLHPELLSTKWAMDQNIPIVQVQHHHAHIASCMAEHMLDEKVIGVAMDGIGMGDDGKVWGGEFFICDLNEYQREYHLDYIPQPGGDAATKHPWRMAVSYLYYYFGEEFLDYNLPFLDNVNPEELNLIMTALKKDINCPQTSSTGRLFDAVSAITNLCINSSFHAEAPMRLESEIDSTIEDNYEFEIIDKAISFRKTFENIISDLKDKANTSIIASKFHNTIINAIFISVSELRKDYNIDKVILSGGTFQNRYLLEKTENLLLENNFNVFTHSMVPSNDGGLALGQLIIAAKRRELKCV